MDVVLSCMAAYVALFATQLLESYIQPNASQRLYLYLVGSALKMYPVLRLGAAMRRLSDKAQPAVYLSRVSTGLLLGSLGDFILDMETLYPQLFVAGLASFLLSHVFYVRAFLASGSAHSLPVAVAMTAFPAAILPVLLPHVPSDLAIPVVVYVMVITSMIYSAAVRTRSLGRSFWLTMAGALVFALSDFILAWNKFVSPLPALRLPFASTAATGGLALHWLVIPHTGKIAVMLTYYAAQVLIFSGAVAAASSSDADGVQAVLWPVDSDTHDDEPIPPILLKRLAEDKAKASKSAAGEASAAAASPKSGASSRGRRGSVSSSDASSAPASKSSKRGKSAGRKKAE